MKNLGVFRSAIVMGAAAVLYKAYVLWDVHGTDIFNFSSERWSALIAYAMLLFIMTYLFTKAAAHSVIWVVNGFMQDRARHKPDTQTSATRPVPHK